MIVDLPRGGMLSFGVGRIAGESEQRFGWLVWYGWLGVHVGTRWPWVRVGVFR